MTHSEIGSLEKLKSIHPFPARMAPSIALEELRRNEGKSLRVLDPMMGSGTTVVLGRILGHQCHGIDIDPLAVLQAKTWTHSANAQDLELAVADTIIRAREIHKHLKLKDAFPADADLETKKFIRFWFDARARRQLTCLSIAISEQNASFQNFLYTALSRTIIAKNRGVSLAMDLSHSRPHKAYVVAPVTPFEEFPIVASRIIRDCPFVGEQFSAANKQPACNIGLGDARKIKKPSKYFDLILTSPPYLNAIDYIRCSKFALVWMGHTILQLRHTRRTSIGAEISISKNEADAAEELLRTIPARKKLRKRQSSILDRYVIDMQLVVRECSRLLKESGRAVFVVGDSNMQGVFVSNSRIVERLGARYSLRLINRENREIVANRRYLPPPKAKSGAAMNSRMGKEVILTFEREAR